MKMKHTESNNNHNKGFIDRKNYNNNNENSNKNCNYSNNDL